MPKRTAPDREDVIVSPIDFHHVSNGEWIPQPPTERQRRAEALWRRIVEEKHRRLGMTRREFAESASGMAAALWVLNQTGCATPAGSTKAPAAGYAVTPGMMDDPAQAREVLGGDDFIFDCHTHPQEWKAIPPWPEKKPSQQALDYISQMFVQSETNVACMTGWPNVRGLAEANLKSHTMLRELIERLGGSRFLFHANANPDLDGEADYIEGLHKQWKHISAWKTYPHAKQTSRLHDAAGRAFIERVRATGIKIIASHRGISDNKGYHSSGSPEDVVLAARMFPDVKFLMYHSGFEEPAEENHPYDPNTPPDACKGIDRFVRAMEEARLAGQPVRNVWADIGTTWYRLAGHEGAAAHVIGKLIKYVGEDRVLWGSDSMNNGVAQGQIARMRTFVLPPELGYPAITPELRKKIFGLNGAAVYGIDPKATLYKIKEDDVSKLRAAYLDDPRSVPTPHPEEYKGPRTRRQLLAMTRAPG
jgi:hypothetical protein